jgi:hypothetical protein
MEGGLGLVREGHRDGIAIHGVRAPGAEADRVLLSPPRSCGLRHVTSLPAPVLRKNIICHYTALWVLNALAGSAAGFEPSGI